VQIDADGEAHTCRTPIVFVGNNEYAIDGVSFGSRARLDEGKLFAYVTPRTSTRDMPMLAGKAMVGRAGQSGAFEILPASELTVGSKSERLVRVAIDGETTMMRQPLRFRACPGGLRVVLPRG
jgi:diacylglycerol kinase family enzyme